MSFIEAIRTVLSKYATFSGRATRAEFWWWMLFFLIVNVVTGLIDGAVIAPAQGFEAFSKTATQPLSFIIALAFFLPTLSVAIRRLRDVGRSDLRSLVCFVPFIGGLVLLYWMTLPGIGGQMSNARI